MIKHRSLGMQVLLVIVTLGVYGIYWYYIAFAQMLAHQREDGSAGMQTFLLFVPIAGIFAIWKFGGLVEGVTNRRYSQGKMFLIFVFLGPVGWWITQTELNKLATQQA